MSDERISEAGEQRLLAAVRKAIAQTNVGTEPNVALAKAAAAENYGPDFVGRMVEIYNTSRTLAHLKQAQGVDRAKDFPLADVGEVLSRMFAPVSSQGQELGSGLSKAADYMALRPQGAETAQFEKAAALMVDGAPKFNRVVNAVCDLEQDIVNLSTKKAECEMKRDTALSKAAEYFRRPGHARFADVDARMQSMFGQAGKLAMDVVWDTVAGLGTEKRAVAPEKPMLAHMDREPYCHLEAFVMQSMQMAKMAARVLEKTAELSQLKAALKDRVANFNKEATGLTSLATIGLVGRALEGTPALGGSEATGMRAQQRAVENALDPEHENAIRAIHTESMLQDLMANDPVVSKYDPSDIVDAYNDLASMSPVASSQPVVLRGYLRRLLESSPDTKGRVLEGHEAGQLADLEKTLRGGRESLKDVLSALE